MTRDEGDLDRWQTEAFIAAGQQYDDTDEDEGLPVIHLVGGFPVVETEARSAQKCNQLLTRGRLAGTRCSAPAGYGTVHLGAGRCIAHGGAKLRGRTYGAWLMAHGFAREMNVNPWDALLMAVRIAAGRVAYIEYVLGTARNDLELEGRAVEVVDGGDGSGGPGGAQSRLLVHPDTGEPLGVGEYRDLSWWVEKSEVWHDRLARTAKMAVDAGVAAFMVEKAQTDAEAIARVLNSVIEGLDSDETVSASTIARVRTLMRSELLRIDEEQSGARELTGS